MRVSTWFVLNAVSRKDGAVVEQKRHCPRPGVLLGSTSPFDSIDLKGMCMKKELSLVAAAIMVILPLASADASQTINFGPSAPAGTINSYAGFNWYGAQNDVYADSSVSFFDSASVTAFGRNKAFDLNSVDFLTLNSDVPSGGDTADFTTVISGYLNGTLVKSLTENYAWGGGAFSGLNLDDVNKVSFKTTVTTTVLGEPGSSTISDFTLVNSLNVSKAAKAPEMDAATGAGALTLLAGALLVMGGRRRPRLS
jgi:hypothetical protein